MVRSSFKPELRMLQELAPPSSPRPPSPPSSHPPAIRTAPPPRKRANKHGAPSRAAASGRPPPSTARMPQFLLPGNSAAAMRMKLAGVKLDSQEIDAKMEAIFGAARSQKAKSRRSSRMREWREAQIELGKERSEAERSLAQWRLEHAPHRGNLPPSRGGHDGKAKAFVAGGSNGGEGQAEAEESAALAELVAEELQADEARREWSCEMRSQLRDMRELCAVTDEAHSPPTLTSQLLCELRRSVASQSQALQQKVEVLEAEIASHMAIVNAADDDPVFAKDSSALSVPQAIEKDPKPIQAIVQLSGAFVSPPELRSAGEQQLLEQLGASLMAEEASHKEALAALRIEFGEVLSRRSTAPPLEVAGDYFVLPAETDEQEDLEARQMEMGGEEGGEEGGEGENDMMAEGNGREEGSHMLQGAGAIADHHKAVDTRGGGGAVLQLPAETTPATSSSSVNNTTRIDSSVLARIVKLEKQLRGRPRAQLVERVSQELGVEASCVEDHLSSLARRKGYTARRRGLVAAWEERRRELGRQARKLLQEEAAREGSTAEQKTQAELLEAQREQLHAELSLLSKARAEREAEAEAERKEAEAVQEKLEEARKARAEAERSHKKALIEQYRHEKSQAEEEQAERALAEAALAEQERLKQAEYNLQRVQFRAEQLALREELRDAQRAQARIEEEEAQARLQRVREKVVAAMGITADSERATGATAASLATCQPKVELFPVHGYSEQTLMKDIRYKLGIALSNAGLRHTEYGRTILTSDKFGIALRPDAIESAIKLG